MEKRIKNQFNRQFEGLTHVTFHGGREEQISDAELIQDVTFHGGREEQISDAELIQDVTFHGYTVWCCTNEYCGAIFNGYHDGKCPCCGASLEAQNRKYPAPRD